MFSATRRSIRRGYWAGRSLGFRWLAYRGLYAAQQRSGYFEQRLPLGAWDATPLQTLLLQPELAQPDELAAWRCAPEVPFFFDPAMRPAHAALLSEWDAGGRSPIQEALALADGQLRFFGGSLREIGAPPDWLRNIVTGEECPSSRHWSRIDEFAGGDIKIIWEPSRFAFAYTLVRAYWRTGDERWPELFWEWLADWRRCNPPQRGPNWKCGQEVSLRVLAWCFALYGFQYARATTPARIAMLVQMMAVSGERISTNLAYALSQHNNHAISEGTGLWTIGLLFPELRSAAHWLTKGRQVLEQAAVTLIYADGAFSQNSLNYHRLMLHDYIWAMRLGELHGQPLSKATYQQVAKAAEFLYQLQDAASGCTSRYGANDGSLILPLDNCTYEDFRPVVQAVSFLVTGTRRFDAGHWDESLFWLFGPDAVKAQIRQVPRVDFSAEPSGYYTLRSSEGFAFTRCPVFHDRPAHADILHVDIWWRGHNIACDAGTYSYNAAGSWLGAFDGTSVHNTVAVDGLDQMERAGRFLWLPWARGNMLRRWHSPDGCVGYWEGMHDGYARLPAPVAHRRAILALPHETWVVIDDLVSRKAHTYRLHWLLDDYVYTWRESAATLELSVEGMSYRIGVLADDGCVQYQIVRSDTGSSRGWRTNTYFDSTPALSFTAVSYLPAVRFVTVFGPEWQQTALDGEALRVKLPQGENVVMLAQTCNDHSAIVRTVYLADQPERTYYPGLEVT